MEPMIMLTTSFMLAPAPTSPAGIEGKKKKKKKGRTGQWMKGR